MGGGIGDWIVRRAERGPHRTAVIDCDTGTDGDAVDRLHSEVFTALLSQENPYTIESAIDVTLLSRYYERFADHAVSVARRLVFLVTGEQ